MSKHPLASQIADHLEKIHFFHKALKTSIDGKDVHGLRVETKRMRAMLRLLRFFQPHWPYRKHYSPFRALFHAAGALRELQLQVGMLEAAPNVDVGFYNAYRDFLLGELVEAHRNLHDVLQCTLPVGEQIEADVDMQFKFCAREDYLRYFQQKTAEIHQFLENDFARHPENIHPMRKALKDYNNNRRNLKNALGVDVGPVKNLPGASENLEQLLGDWNDYHTALLHLEGASAMKWAKDYAASLESLRQFWINCSEALLLQLESTVEMPK